MIPKKLDYTKDECRGALRHLELQAYSSVISTFRAQGSLDGNKQGVLDQLRKCFHISEDRHKAEVRRVANNEKLTTISEILNGKSYDLEWIREGHRNYPLISRAPSYTALHLLADHASKFAELENTELPTPSETKRERNLSCSEISGVPMVVVVDDPTKPPSIPTPAIFGISKKDLKRNIDLVTLHPHNNKKKHYHHLKPPPPPNIKIQHLYQTLNTKRPRKSLTKKSLKTKNTKQSPGSSASRLQFPYPQMLQSSPLSSDEKLNFDGAELQRHLTSSQLMPPPMSPMKVNAFSQQLALPTTSSSSKNLLKINHQQQQQIEPQAHYIPNNHRLKNEILTEHPQQATPSSSRARSGRSKSVNVSSKGNFLQKYSNGAGMRNNSMDYIPDPQIIFNTSSSKTVEPSTSPQTTSHTEVPIESNEMEMSPAITSPLQLLSTAASCTPKLKINASLNQTQFHQLQSSSLATNNTTTVLTNQHSSGSTLKSVHNRAIKIIPANAKPVIIKPQQQTSDAINKIQQSVPQQIITASTATPSKFKIQKIQLVMNKNQDGTASTSLSPTATFVSGKAGQLVLSGKGITNTYQVGGQKPPYTILSSAPKVAPKVIVQTIDRNFAQKEENVTDRIPENQRITENTPIDFLPVSTKTTSSNTPQTSSFPKVIIPSANATTTIAPKQIKLKLGPGSIVNSKIFKGPLPTNLKIQRNINTKGFTVLNTTLNTSQIVQIQSSLPTSSIASVAPTTPKIAQPPAEIPAITVTVASNESTKTDWEQELDDVNRSKAAECGNKEASNGNAPAAKKARIDESLVEIVQSTDESLIVESTEEQTETSSNVIYAENLPQVEEEEIHEQMPITAEYLYLNNDLKESTENNAEEEVNGEENEETLANGQFDIEERGHNGAEAYENLVKSLTECDGDYMKEMSETQIDENFGLIDGNMLETITYVNRESEGLF